MAINRRSWLKLVAHSPWLAVFFGRWASAQAAETAFPAQALKSLVDTLVPADESPGALDLDIHTAMQASISRHREYRELLASGVEWLERESAQRYQARFSELPADARELLLSTAEKQPRASAQRRLLRVLRSDVMQRYYTHQESWVGLGYQGPPQPRGFSDYDKRPVPPRG